MEGKIITSPAECGYRNIPQHYCTHAKGPTYCTANSAYFPTKCPLQSIILKDNKQTENNPVIEDIQKEDNLLVLEKELPTQTRTIECPICKGKGLVHTEEGSGLTDCDNCDSKGYIEVGS